MRNSLKRVVLLNGVGVSYLMRDDFTDTLSAGSVDGTDATPGPGVRDVTDSSSGVSVSGGSAEIVGNTNWSQAGLVWTPGVTREVGRLLVADVSNTVAGEWQLYWASTQAIGPGNWDAAFGEVGGNVRIWEDGSKNRSNVYPLGSAPHEIAIVLRAVGAFYFYRVSSDWMLIYIGESGNAGTVYTGIEARTATVEVDHFRTPEALWAPTPLASDGAFGATTDGQGHAETSGLGSGGDGLTWTDSKGTWSGGSASALSGGEAIRTVDAGSADVLVDLDITRTGGNASIMLRYTDDSNYLRCGTDGTNMTLVEKVAGVENTLLTTAITYSAGAAMRIRLEGQSARVFYNSVFVSATSSIDAALTNTKIGMYTTDTGNSFDNLVAYASTGHARLNQYVS